VENDILKAFGLKVRLLRNSRGWSQEELAERTGFHRTYIGMLERGERNIALRNIKIISNAFETPMKDFFNDL
jgi:transcriptional regulator with XRE-family HTH domain